eukprot:3775614-Pyramimonas_sp.AAC.1
MVARPPCAGQEMPMPSRPGPLPVVLQARVNVLSSQDIPVPTPIRASPPNKENSLRCPAIV